MKCTGCQQKKKELDLLKKRIEELEIALTAMNHPVQNYIPKLDKTVDEILQKGEK